MSYRLLYTALLLTTAALFVDAHAAEPAPDPANVMLLGVFHFENPGLDVVKSDVVDVTTAANQAYLTGLATRLAAFRPTDVLVECAPSAQDKQDAAYAAWRDGTAAMDVDETQQIGFRVAQATGLDGVTCFDEGNVHWNGEPLFEYVGAHAPAQNAAMDTVFESLSARTTREQTTLPLPELLRLTHDPERDRENKDL